MSLPSSSDAWIPRAKLQEYLLDPDHPTGGAKARFSAQLGYTREDLEALVQALLALARRETVEQQFATPAWYQVRALVTGAADIGGR